MFGIAATSGTVIAQSRSGSRINTFTSPNGDFQFRYPASLIDCKAQRGGQSCGGFMPVCSGFDYDSLACIAYPRDRVAESETFDGAAFVVALEESAHDEKACYQIPDPPPPSWSHPHWESINGVKFWVIHTGGVPSGTAEDQRLYRAFHNNVCYELDINTSSVNPMMYDPPRPKMYDQAPVNKALQQTLQSFKFLK
jgi:hypothetical protein